MAQARQSCDRGPSASRGGDRHYAAAFGAWPQERQAAYDSCFTAEGGRRTLRHRRSRRSRLGEESADRGWGILARGREQESVNLVELPLQERAPVSREFPNRVPHGVQFFRQLYGISGTPEEFEALAS